MSEPISGIYAIVNRHTGKMYIGSSIDIEYRWRKHREELRRGRHHCAYLMNSFKKHGEESFIYMVLCLASKEMLPEIEQQYLWRDGLYNSSKSSVSPLLRGESMPEEWRANMVRGFHEKFLNKVLSGEIVHPNTGKKYSQEIKDKVGAASKKSWQKNREKIVDAMRKGVEEKYGAERRNGILKKLWADPVYRANAIAARNGNAYNSGWVCTPEQVLNRRKAARISNMKRNYGEGWREEYVKRYPEFAHEVSV